MESPTDKLYKRRRMMKILWLLDMVFVTISFTDFTVWMFWGLYYVLTNDHCFELNNDDWKKYVLRFAVPVGIVYVWITLQLFLNAKLADGFGNVRVVYFWLGAQCMLMVFEITAAEYFFATSFLTQSGCFVWVGFDCRCWVIAVACFVCAVKRGVGIWIGDKYKDVLEKEQCNVGVA